MPRNIDVPLRIPTSVERLGDRVTFRIGRPLKNVNAGSRNPHWSVKSRERKRWQAVLVTAAVDGLGIAPTLALLGPKCGIVGARGACTERRRVHIERQVPAKRHLIRDEFDNLRWSTKELRDVLTGLALIKDDSSEWCDMSIAQSVSPDKQWWTVITIDRARSTTEARTEC